MPHETLVHERLESIEGAVAGRRDRLDGLEREGAGEDGERSELAPLGLGDEVVAPVARIAQRSVSDGGGGNFGVVTRFEFALHPLWSHPAGDEEHVAWARGYWQAMHPNSGGVYLNVIGHGGKVRRSCGPHMGTTTNA